MKKLKKLVVGFSFIAVMMSMTLPAFAYSPILGWRTEGTYTGWPYISWTESGKLWGAVAAQNKTTNQLFEYTPKNGTDILYVRTPESKLYYEGTYKGYYDYRYGHY